MSLIDTMVVNESGHEFQVEAINDGWVVLLNSKGIYYAYPIPSFTKYFRRKDFYEAAKIKYENVK